MEGGAKSDFLFTYHRNLGSGRGYEISLSAQFTNQVDGIQKYLAGPVSWQSLRLPHEAPKAGYNEKWFRMFGLKSDKYFNQASMENDANYFFRIRTELDRYGNITNSLYGKIYGEIDTVGHKVERPILIFTYYLNPTPNDRNVEFDPEKNLSGEGGFSP